MMVRRMHGSVITAAAMVALFGCGDTATDGGSSVTNLDPVSNLLAYSAGQTSVGLVWIASPAALSSDMQDHQVRVLGVPSGGLVSTFTVPKADTSFVVTGLLEGTRYQFEVLVRPSTGSSGKGNSPSVSVIWSAARRLPTDASGGALRVYETASGSNPSGLILLKGTAPAVVSVLSPSPLSDTALIDLYLRSEGDSVVLRSADLFSGGRVLPRFTRFSSVVRNANSLDDPASSPPDTATYGPTNGSRIFSSAPVATSQIYFIRANDGNYGRLLVKRQANGSMIGGAIPDRYLELEVSYQATQYNGYARRK